MTAILGGSNKGRTAQIRIQLTGKRTSAGLSRPLIINTNNGRVINTVVLTPFSCFFKAHEACSVAVFKIEDDFGTFAEFNCISKNGFTVSDGNINTSNRSIGCCGKVETVKSTCFFIRKLNRDSVDINIYVCFAGHCNNREADGTNFIRSRIRDDRRSCRKFENFRVCNSDGFGTYYFAAGNDLNINFTFGSVGNEFAIFNGTEGAVRKCPGCVCRHIHCVSVGIDCFCTEGINGFRSKDIIIRYYVYNIKLTGRCNVGSNEDTVCGRTLCTIARYGTHGESFFTNTFGKEGGRTAAVAVCCPFATKSKHSFAFFIVAETNGVVCTTSIVHTDYESTVFFNTNHGTCSCCRSSFFGFGNKFAVFNNHSKGNAYCMEKGFVCKIAVKFFSVECFNVAGNVAFCILKNVKDGTGRSGFTFNAEILTVINKNAGCIGVIIKVGVHTANDVISEVLLVIFCHLGKFLMGPVGLLAKVLIDLVISGNNGYVRVGRINFDYVDNLSSITSSVVENHFILNRCVGNKIVFLFRNYVIVTIGTDLMSRFNIIAKVGSDIVSFCFVVDSEDLTVVISVFFNI